MKVIEIGSAKSEPGKLTYGFFDCIELPTGRTEQLPVMIAQGLEEGPTFFLTANIHGAELTGIPIIHELVTTELAQELKGTVVALPTLNPSGLRHLKRSPEFDDQDPNRFFPDGRFADKEDEQDEEKKYPKPAAQVAQKIYELMETHADFLIDFHNHSIQSIPFSILDRVFYDSEANKGEAEELFRRVKEMVEAFGVTICVEFPAAQYLKQKLHRSVSGAALNNVGIPSFTAELGENSIINKRVVAGSIKATRNTLKWAGMLDGAPEVITEFPILQPSERIRRFSHPRVKQSGLINFVVEPGDQVTKDQPIAKITDIFGRSLGDGYIRTDYNGYIIALRPGLTYYPNAAICEMGIKDTDPLVVPLPKKKNKLRG